MSDHEPTLIVQSGHADGSVTISVTGEIDSSNCTELHDELLRAAAGDDGRCTVDLSGVSFMDSSGLRALLIGHRALSDAGKAFVVAGVSDSVRRLLEITGLLERFGLPG